MSQKHQILNIESALEVALMFDEFELAAIYKEALQKAGITYTLKSKSWLD